MRVLINKDFDVIRRYYERHQQKVLYKSYLDTKSKHFKLREVFRRIDQWTVLIRTLDLYPTFDILGDEVILLHELGDRIVSNKKISGFFSVVGVCVGEKLVFPEKIGWRKWEYKTEELIDLYLKKLKSGVKTAVHQNVDIIYLHYKEIEEDDRRLINIYENYGYTIKFKKIARSYFEE